MDNYTTWDVERTKEIRITKLGFYFVRKYSMMYLHYMEFVLTDY